MVVLVAREKNSECKRKKKISAKTVKPKAKKIQRKMFQYCEDDLKKALYEIRENKMKIREASRKFNVPKTTIIDRISGRVPDTLRKPGPPPLLTVEGEERIKNWVIHLAKCGFPIKKGMLIDTVRKITADANQNVFKDGLPKQTWYLNFLKRNPEISLREAEGINKARAIVTQESIRKWFKELTQFLRDENLIDVFEDPRRIFNGDESGFALCPKTGKVLGPKGFKNLYSVKQGNEKENVTVLIVFNADGKFAPPLVLFPYVRPPRALVDNMPENWVLGRSEKGWMTSDVFFEYTSNDFNSWLIKENIPRPIILFVDGHKSHLNMATSQWCDENQVILYALPPNTTHILQPADVSVFRPMKADWKKTVSLWQNRSENINSCVTKINFCKVFNEVLKDEVDFEIKIKNGFRKCGLFPLNPDAVDYSKCVVNTAEHATKPRPRRSSENHITQRDINSAKKVINKIKNKLESYGINSEVIINEIDLLDLTTVSPKKNFCDVMEIQQSSIQQDTALDTAEPMSVVEPEVSNKLQNSTEYLTISMESEAVKDINKVSDEPATGINTESVISLLDVDNINMSFDLPNISLPSGFTSSFLNGIQTDEDLSIINISEAEISKFENIILQRNIETDDDLPIIVISDSRTAKLDNKSDEIQRNIEVQENENNKQENENIEPENEVIINNSEEKEKSKKLDTSSDNIEELEMETVFIHDVVMYNNGNNSGNNNDQLKNIEIEKEENNNNEENIDLKLNKPLNNTNEQETVLFHEDVIKLPEPLQNTNREKTVLTLRQAFDNHLTYPDPIKRSNNTNRKKMEKAPSAISSYKWRDYYKKKDEEKQQKTMDIQQRKEERKRLKENKQQKKLEIKTKKPTSNNVQKHTSKTTLAKTKKIPCALCEDILNSDTEDDEKKNIGCDFCDKWYHKKCTEFYNIPYSIAASKDYKCDLC